MKKVSNKSEDPDPSPLKASVIILTFNQADTVGRAIESVLRQQCKYPYEILVADDCSTDGTREVCEKYARQFPDVVRMMPRVPNKGIVDNYFDALCAARGEYIGDCAGDDEWLGTERLRMQIEILDKDKSLSAVCSDVESYNAGEGGVTGLMRGSVFAAASAERPERAAGERVLHGVLNHTNALPFVLSSALYRKAPILRMMKAHPDIIRNKDGGVEDVPLIAAIGASGDVVHLPVKGYRYYIDGESVSNNLSYEKEYRFQSRVASLVRRLGVHYGFSPHDQQEYFKTKFPYLAAQARRSGDMSLAEDLGRRLHEWGLPMPLRGRVHLWLLRLRGQKNG